MKATIVAWVWLAAEVSAGVGFMIAALTGHGVLAFILVLLLPLSGAVKYLAFRQHHDGIFPGKR